MATNTKPQQQQQQQRPKQKRLPYWALVIGVSLFSIATRYWQIYSVYHSNWTSPKSTYYKDIDSPTILGVTRTANVDPETEPPTTETEIENQGISAFEKDRPTNTHVNRTRTRSKRTGRGKNKKTKNRTKNRENDTAVSTTTDPENAPAPKLGIKRGARTVEDFLEEHDFIKQKFVEERMQNVTGATRDAVEARAKRLFVDIEKDPVPSWSSNNPWFVLHIGPPKTATTAIQCGLEKYSLRLAKTDGYHYLGGGCGVDKRQYFMPNGEYTVLRRLIVWGLVGTQGLLSPPVQELAQRAKKLRKNGRSVILSSEIFGSQLDPSKRVMMGMKNMIVSSKDGAGFDPQNVRIVIAYRHFVDWLPSYHYQKYAMNTSDKPWITGNPEDVRVTPFLKFVDDYLSRWEEIRREYGTGILDSRRKLEEIEIDPDSMEVDNEVKDEFMLKMEKEIGIPISKDSRVATHPTWWLYNVWSYYFPLKNQVQVYDMHSPMNSNRPRDDTVTNFVCNMIPTANETCSKLIRLEDQKEQQRLINEQNINARSTSNNDKRNLEEQDGDAEFDYDNPALHPKSSYLAVDSKKKLSVNSSNSTEIVVRTSSDHHAAILVEEMMIEGHIRPFDYAEYNESFFETYKGNYGDIIKHHNGLKKRVLIQLAERLLQKHDVQPPSEKYFDCMPKDLEDRLLNTSLAFMDLIYKTTPMLSLAADVSSTSSLSFPGASVHDAAEKIKEKRFEHARAEHTRLFEKNKAKGKYCDISLNKIRKEIPAIYDKLTSFTYKPIFNKLKYRELPENMKAHVDALGIEKEAWNKSGQELSRKKLMKLWTRGTPRHKQAILALFIQTELNA